MGDIPSTMRDVPPTMRAAVFMGLRDVTVEDRPTPVAGPGDLLLEVSHCGICGSDLHFLLEWGGRENVIEGHEFSGTVVAVGADVEGWAIGDRAVGGPSPKCGHCEYCRASRTSLCVERGRVGTGENVWQGAFAGYKATPAAEALRVPEHLSLKHAALTEPLAVSLHGITQGARASGGVVRPGTRWLITGGGPIGYLSVAALKAMGVDDIVVSEPHERRRALAEKLGARVITPDELTTPQWPHDMVDVPFDVVLECSGNGKAMESGLAQLKRAGTLVLVGAGIARPKFDPNRILLNELNITGAYVYDDDGFPRALELLASGKMPNDLLVEADDYPLNRLLDAAVQLHDGELAAKAMVVPKVEA